MAVNQVSCPKCLALLRFAAPVPGGVPVKCPHCQHGFRVPAPVALAVAVASGNGTGAQAAAPLYDGSSELVRVQPVVCALSPIVAAQPVAAGPEEPARVNHGLRVALVLGGFFLLLAVGGALLGLCLSRAGGARLEAESNPVPEPTGSVVPKSKPPVVIRPLIELTAEENATVEELVRKGVAYLKKTQGPEGSWGPAGAGRENYVAFGGLTLLECGVPPHDPAIQKAAQFARSYMAKINRTYPAALFLLFFDRLGDPQDKERIRELAMRLVAGQTAQGGWGYNVPILKGDDTAALTAYLRARDRDGIDTARRNHQERKQALPTSLRNIGLFQTPDNANPEYFRQGGDNSNTQFALLALWAARRHQVPVDHALALVVRRFRNTQKADGSYDYSAQLPRASQLPSMTCAGLLGLAVGHGMTDKSTGVGPAQDAAIQNALRYLSRSIGEPAASPQAKMPMTDMYFLWSTERVAVLYQLKKIMDKDWYRWGFTMLRKNQHEGGSWQGGGHGNGPVPDTCFALLFLKRVNLAKDLTDKLDEINLALLPSDADLPRKE
jgi:hypothetical protein